MARADSNHTTRLSSLFSDPYLRAAFAAAEDDGLAPMLLDFDHPPSLSGGAAEQLTDSGCRRVLALVEA
jgi:hypothetical protein